jgi:hypothetical protein
VANNFANDVVNMTNVTPTLAANLTTVAKREGLTAHLTAPFDATYGPKEFPASPAFIKAAFALTPDDPFAGPIAGSAGYYEIALAKQLPREIPALASIRDRVTQDYTMEQATDLAQRAGTNFVSKLGAELKSAKDFTAACVPAGLHPEPLTPFSLSTQELPPEAAGRATFSDLKQAVFGTQVGHASGFVKTDDGGFVVYVENQLPADTTAMKTDMPEYISELRQTREKEMFNEWLGAEAQRELSGIPLLQQSLAGANQQTGN